MPDKDTVDEICATIQREWDRKNHFTVNWSGLEYVTRAALRLCKDHDPNSATIAIELIDDAVAAFTRRGHTLK